MDRQAEEHVTVTEDSRTGLLKGLFKCLGMDLLDE